MPSYETHVKLRSATNPTAMVGALSITLIRQREISAERNGQIERYREVRLRLTSGNETRDVFLPGDTDETKIMGYILKLYAATDGQLTPSSPRESFVEILVRPATTSSTTPAGQASK